jgi:hypothetical protein
MLGRPGLSMVTCNGLCDQVSEWHGLVSVNGMITDWRSV